MSAADPARTYMDDPDDAAVIHLQPRRNGRGTPPKPKGAATPAPAPVSDSPPDDGREAVLRLIAEDVEKVFTRAGRTLTDDETAHVYVTTLCLVERALQGATVNGIISEEQRQELAILIGGMSEAPRLL